MTIKPLGDSAWWVEIPGESPLAEVLDLVKRLEKKRPLGVCDVVSSFTSLAVHFQQGDALEIYAWLAAASASAGSPDMREGGVFEIPVCYDGEDLEEVARISELSPDGVISLHSGATYTVAAVGFSPGFPYLSGLPKCLHIPRRKTPRLAVAGGSVAIAGGQAGIYPNTSPGGWHVLGHTTEALFHLENSPPALLAPGDQVKFVPVPTLSLRTAPLEIYAPEDPMIEVLQPGAMTSVQDLGRTSYEASGVSPGGAMDRGSLRIANLLVGNPQGAAGLEICVSGPILQFYRDTIVAWVDGIGKTREIAAGEVVDFSKLTCGVRGYLAVAGGIKVPLVLGSSSTDLRAGFGGHRGRALQAGDHLQVGEPGYSPKPTSWHIGRGGRVSRIELRYLRGVQADWYSAGALENFRTGTYRLTPQSDRMGARLSGPPLELKIPREMTSQPVACGSIQVPPDGQPIVLLAERQTLGGYPQIGHVISVDLPKFARAWPGTSICFREISWDEAQQLKQAANKDIGMIAAGISFKI